MSVHFVFIYTKSHVNSFWNQRFYITFLYNHILITYSKNVPEKNAIIDHQNDLLTLQTIFSFIIHHVVLKYTLDLMYLLWQNFTWQMTRYCSITDYKYCINKWDRDELETSCWCYVAMQVDNKESRKLL